MTWLESQGRQASVWADQPDDDATNPHLVVADGIRLAGRLAVARAAAMPWPTPYARRCAGALDRPAGDPEGPELRRLDELERDIELLLAEAAAETAGPRRAVAGDRCRDDRDGAARTIPAQFARELARPMPRQPSGAARFGTRFHAWVEAHFGQQTLLDPTDLPGTW